MIRPRVVIAVLSSILLHAAAMAGALLGPVVPRLPFVEFEIAEIEDESEPHAPVAPTDEPPAPDEPSPPVSNKLEEGEKPPPPREDVEAPADEPEPDPLVRDEPLEESPEPVEEPTDGVVIPESGPTSAPAKLAQGPPGKDGPPHQPSTAPLTEDPTLAWRSLRGSGSPLGEHVPGDARMAVWVHMAALRRSPLRADIADTLKVLAGLHELVGWAGIDLVEDADELVIASPNPYVPGLLYLALQLRGARDPGGAPAEAFLASLGEKARRVEIKAGVHVFAPADLPKPPYVMAALAPAVLGVFPTRRAAKLLDPGPGPASRPVPVGGKFTTLLGGEGAAPRRADAPEILLSATGLEKLLPMIDWGPDFAPAPESLRVAVDVVVGAQIHAEMRFATEADAKLARDAWTRVLEELRGAMLLRILGVRPLLDRVDVWADGTALRGTLELYPDEAVRVLRAIRPLLVGEPE